MGGKERRVIKGVRKTGQGKKLQEEKEQERKKDAAIFKATLKQKSKVADEDDDSDWESDVEEDFPHVKLTELLDNLKLDE